MFYWSFTSLVHFWPPSIFNPGYAHDGTERCCTSYIHVTTLTIITNYTTLHKY